MRWGDIEKALVDALTLASGGVVTHWTKRKSAWRNPKYIRLDVLTLTQAAPADVRLTYVPDEAPSDDGHFAQHAVTSGVMVLQITASSQSQELSESALAIAHRARASMDLAEVRAILLGANLALASLGDVRDVSVRDMEGRFVSEAVFEARLNTSTLIEGAPIETFLSVVHRGEVRDVGTPNSDPPDWVIEETIPV